MVTLGIPTSCELVAQLVEQCTFNAWVLGSSPSELTMTAHSHTRHAILALRRTTPLPLVGR